jgi:hypothetical protein
VLKPHSSLAAEQSRESGMKSCFFNKKGLLLFTVEKRLLLSAALPNGAFIWFAGKSISVFS